MITVLVTGGNGQLASCIKDVTNAYDGYTFIYTDYPDLDICDVSKVNDFFSLNTIDFCINCAAYTAVDKAEEEKDIAFEINSNGVKNLAKICSKYNTKLVHISTDFVFEGLRNMPYKETDIATPISVYGATKLQGEIEIQKSLAEHYIIRTSWLYSEHGNNFMKTMLRLAEFKDEIGVISDQIGTPTYAGDLAKVIMEIIHKDLKPFGLYHYSNSGVASWYDFAMAIFDISNSKIKVNPISTSEYPTAAKRPTFSLMDKTKIKTTVKIEIPYWRDSLTVCLNKAE